MRKKHLLLALALVAFSASGEQVVTRCTPAQKCQPPQTFRYEAMATPFNAPVIFGGVQHTSGQPMWLWLKAGEPPTPCEDWKLEDPAWAPYCNAKIGEPLYQTHEFRVTYSLPAAVFDRPVSFRSAE